MRTRIVCISVLLALALAVAGCRKHHHGSSGSSSDGGGGSSGGGAVVDVASPAAVIDLSLTNRTHITASFTWTAPGNDGNVGTAAVYDLRYSTGPIGNYSEFDAATGVVGEPTPGPAGSAQWMTVSGLTPSTTYWFAICTSDEALNRSPLSNVVVVQTLAPPDFAPPGAVTDLTVVSLTSISAFLQWTAPGDDGATGTASWYHLRYSSLPITSDADFDGATPVDNVPLPSPAGEMDSMLILNLTPGVTYYFALKTLDEVPNTSVLSNVPSGTTTVPDTTPPAAISDLAAGLPTFDSMTLTWTAPGDDGVSGTAAMYDVRYSMNPIVTDADFDAAPSAGVPPMPSVAGNAETMVVSGLQASTTYWFAIKTSDEVPNTSGLSNVVSQATAPPPDVTPPSAVADLAVTAWTDTSITLSWTAPGDDGATGTATLYDIHYAATPITDPAGFAAANHCNGEPAPLPAGTIQTFVVNGLAPGSTWYFSIRSSDEVPNVSAVSNSPAGTTSAFPVILTVPEVEPNNTTQTATPLPDGSAGQGNLDNASDVDFWSFSATAGDIIRIELFGTRMSQATWSSSDAIPMLRILNPSGQEMLRHDRSHWKSGDHDLDVPEYRIGTTGTWFLRLQASNGAAIREYAVYIRRLQMTLTMEAEAPGVSGVNDTFATAQFVTTPAVVFAWHKDGESDYFSFNATAGSILRFEIVGYRNGIFQGQGYLNPRLWLYDPSGSKVEMVSESIFKDAEFTYLVTHAGNWRIRVLEDGGSKGEGPYFLSINATPAPNTAEAEPNNSAATANAIAYGDYRRGSSGIFDPDWYSFTGSAGDMVRIKVYDKTNSQDSMHDVSLSLRASDGVTVLPGQSQDGILNTYRAILRENGTHYIKVTGVSMGSHYAIELDLFKSAAWETEANDSSGTADSLDANRRAAGAISAPGDVDTFSFAATANELASFAIYAKPAHVPPGSDGDSQRSGYASTLSPKLTIRDSGGSVVSSALYSTAHISSESITNPLPTFELTFVAPATGSYTITVEDQYGASSATATYILERR